MPDIFHISPASTNIGDEVIALGVRQFIDRAFDHKANIIRLPAQTNHRIGGLTVQSVHAINRLGHGVVVGGGNFLENGRLSLDTAALGSLQVPLMLFSVSYGHVIDRRGQYAQRTDSMSRQSISALAERADVVCLRDNATEKHFRSFGIRAGRAGGCPSLFLDPPHPNIATPADIGQTVLISVRAPETMNLPPARQGLIERQVREIAYASRKLPVARVALLCNDLADIDFAERIGEQDYIVSSDVHQHCALLARCALCVTYRLHTMLPCLAFGRPVIYAGFEERTLDISGMIGLGDWMIDLNETSDAVAAFMDRHRRIAEFAELYRSTSGLRSRSREALELSMLDFSNKVSAYTCSITH